jgi:hypothetical protein
MLASRKFGSERTCSKENVFVGESDLLPTQTSFIRQQHFVLSMFSSRPAYQVPHMFSSIRRLVLPPSETQVDADREADLENADLYSADLYHPDGTRRTIVCKPGLTDDVSWRRSKFEGSGCTIYAWPCSGGVVIKDDADVVDMAFLGFDRFLPPTHRFPAEQQEREEEFARLLRRVGGKWWSSPLRASQVAMGWKEAEGSERESWFFGWAPADGSGGVWALCYDVDDERIPETAILRMAVTMEERCVLLEKLGAKLYADPRECEGLKDAYTNPEKSA